MSHSLRPVVCAPRRSCAPSFLRPVVPAPRRSCAPSFLLLSSLVASLLLASPDAQAGTYSGPVYSGTAGPPPAPGTTAPPPVPGAIVSLSGTQTTTYPYMINGQGSGYGSGVAGNPGTCSLSGAITTTFTWQPATGLTMTTDPPPATVIVQETCQTWVGDNYIPASASSPSCANGLSTPVVVTSQPLGNPAFGTKVVATSNGTRYTAPVGGPTVALSCTPSGSSGAVFSSGAAVSYTAAVFPVTVNLTGAIKDSSGNYNILVGQGCTASLSGIPGGCTVSNYSWSVSDAALTFQTWSGATPAIPPAPANANASYYSPGPGPLNNSTAHWYWDDNATTATVTCTATVTPPAGQGSAFPVTVTQSVNIAVPQTTENPTIGTVQINNHAPAGYGTNYALYLGGTGTSQSYGIIFTTQVLTPALFASSSSGLWNMVQEVAPNLWTTLFPGLYQTPSPGNGSSGLDTHYPLYPWSSGASPFFPSGIVANNLMAQPYDGPGIASLSYTISRYRVSESFRTYVMYLPPGSDTQWVPVWLVTWHWNADDTAPIVNGQPSWSTWNGTSAGNAAIDSNAATLVFPTWTQITSG